MYIKIIHRICAEEEKNINKIFEDKNAQFFYG